jgi:hypothetical protein
MVERANTTAPTKLTPASHQKELANKITAKQKAKTAAIAKPMGI